MNKIIALLSIVLFAGLGLGNTVKPEKGGIEFFEGTFKEAMEKAKKENKLIFLDAYASWCGPCKAMAPILDQVKNEVGDNASIIKIDVDRNQQIAQSLQIQGVPTLILYKNGKQLWRQSGVVQKEMLVNLLNQHS